jgi:hypothetical protein
MFSTSKLFPNTPQMLRHLNLCNMKTSRRRWEGCIKMDLREIRYYDMDWINLAQDRDQ